MSKRGKGASGDEGGFKSALGRVKTALAERAASEKAAQAAAKLAATKPKATAAPGRPSRAGTASDDDAALGLAMQGVKPLARGKPRAVGVKVDSRTAQAARVDPSALSSARARLDALVADELDFRIERDGQFVEACRVGADRRVLKALASKRSAELKLDLHGMKVAEVEQRLPQLLRRAYRDGTRVVCVVHGKGLHSEGGAGVLDQVAIRVLTTSGAAPIVLAFRTAPRELGGEGALLVMLGQ